MSAMNEQEPREVKDCDFPPGMPVNANTFPGKLWKLVSDDFYQSINWSNNGTSIGIDALQFKHEVLKCDDSVFKTKNFSSFVRQLNLYGFRKITSVHPSSRACEFSNSHPHQQLNSELQHFQHSCFNRAHPELLIRVRRASAAQKRKAQENAEFHGFPNHPHFPRGLGVSSFNTQGILRDRTNLNKPYHNCIPTCKGRQAPFPVSLHANQGKIFGLSLIASTTRGSLIATPTSDQFDFNKLCNPNGQLKKYVVIGRQDAFDDEPMLSDSSLLSPKMPILKAYNMSPLGNPKSSVGYALTEAPLDTSISEAENAVSFLLNETFDSSPSSSPQPLSPWQQAPSPDPDAAPDSPQPLPLSSSTSCQSSDSTSDKQFSYSGTSSSHLSRPSSRLSGPSSCSTSGTSCNSSCFSSDTPSLYHTSSSSSLYSSGLSFSTGSAHDGSTMMSAYGSSRSNSSMLPPSNLDSHSDVMLPPSSLASHPGKDMFPPASLASHPESMLPPSGKDFSSSFMNAVPDFNRPLSHPAMANPFSMHPEQPLMVEQGILLDCEEQLAAPLPPSPVGFAGGLMHPSGHAVSSTPIMSGPPGCTTPNCPCQHGKGQPMFCPPPPPFQLFNVQPMSLDPY